jgi:hypothetical protein
MGVLDLLIALAIGLAVWRVSVWMIRLLATPPPEVDPDDVVAADRHYRCTICGTEVTLTVANLKETAAPRHCREDMVLVWRP